MSQERTQIGENLRRVRLERDLSLASVALKAGVSVATLSRVETNKQNLDVSLLMTLAEILEVPPAEILGGEHEEEDLGTLTRRLAKLPAGDRARLFLDATRRRDIRQLHFVVDDLLSTIEVFRDELLQLKSGERRRKR